MREIIKMIFFRSTFGFWLVIAIRLLFFYVEDKWSNIQSELNENKEHEKEIMALKKRCEFLEAYWAKRMHWFYNLSEKYDEILEFQIYWKSVEEWMKDKDKWISETVYIKKNKSSWKK